MKKEIKYKNFIIWRKNTKGENLMIWAGALSIGYLYMIFSCIINFTTP